MVHEPRTLRKVSHLWPFVILTESQVKSTCYVNMTNCRIGPS